MQNPKIKIGIIGGSGVDNPEILDDFEKIKKHTPYGRPSDLITVGKYQGIDVPLFLAMVKSIEFFQPK